MKIYHSVGPALIGQVGKKRPMHYPYIYILKWLNTEFRAELRAYSPAAEKYNLTDVTVLFLFYFTVVNNFLCQRETRAWKKPVKVQRESLSLAVNFHFCVFHPAARV
jgi:hypothetical protein